MVTSVSHHYILILNSNQKTLLSWNECKKKNLPLIVGMDSNTHSSMWGAEDTNDRGRELEESFFELNLVVLNQGSEYPFDTGNR